MIEVVIVLTTWFSIGVLGGMWFSWVEYHAWGHHASPFGVFAFGFIGPFALLVSFIGLCLHTHEIAKSLKSKNAKRSFLVWLLSPYEDGDK